MIQKISQKCSINTSDFINDRNLKGTDGKFKKHRGIYLKSFCAKS
jgi:hypothetical protein